MKLTPHLINSAPSYMNPVHDRVLILRGLKAEAIENLGVTNDLNETIDLTDNEIQVLGNIPLLRRLKTLLISQNKISKIDPNLHKSIPNLKHLNLCSNQISDLESAISSLEKCTGLHSLVFKDNEVTSLENYRLYVIWKIPSLKVLDFERIKDKERQELKRLFGEGKVVIGKKILSDSKTQDDKDEGKLTKIVNKLTDEERTKLEQRLMEATNLDEIEKIENALKYGSMD